MDSNRTYKDKVVLLSVCLYEYLGTILLLCSINIGASFSSLPLLNCGMVLLLVHTLGPVSGAHMNPAVTVGQLIGYWGHDDFKEKYKIAVAMILS